MDILSKLSEPSKTPKFDAQPEDVRRALRTAASRGASNLPRPVVDEAPQGWMMVPTRKGMAQIAWDGGRAWRL